jgi:hypothetical protein
VLLQSLVKFIQAVLPGRHEDVDSPAIHFTDLCAVFARAE